METKIENKPKNTKCKNVKLKIAIAGPSGSGKTFSALRVASGMFPDGKILIVDTENESSAFYDDDFNFVSKPLSKPYATDRYINAIDYACKNNYDILILDSISPAWAGVGGLLDKKYLLDTTSRGGNSYTNWKPISKEHEEFKDKILSSNIHIICTLKTKQAYVLEMDDRGKQIPRKIGMGMIQRDGIEYEFAIVFELSQEHYASVTKTRIRAFDNKIFIPSEEIGKKLMQWLKGEKIEI